jgi:hypothetical protein
MSSNPFIILILAIITASALVVFSIVMLPRILDDMQANRDRGVVCQTYRLALKNINSGLDLASSQDEIDRTKSLIKVLAKEIENDAALDQRLNQKLKDRIARKKQSTDEAAKRYREAMELYEDGKCTRVH